MNKIQYKTYVYSKFLAGEYLERDRGEEQTAGGLPGAAEHLRLLI